MLHQNETSSIYKKMLFIFTEKNIQMCLNICINVLLCIAIAYIISISNYLTYWFLY